MDEAAPMSRVDSSLQYYTFRPTFFDKLSKERRRQRRIIRLIFQIATLLSPGSPWQFHGTGKWRIFNTFERHSSHQTNIKRPHRQFLILFSATRGGGVVGCRCLERGQLFMWRSGGALITTAVRESWQIRTIFKNWIDGWKHVSPTLQIIRGWWTTNCRNVLSLTLELEFNSHFSFEVNHLSVDLRESRLSRIFFQIYVLLPENVRVEQLKIWICPGRVPKGAVRRPFPVTGLGPVVTHAKRNSWFMFSWRIYWIK